MLLWCVSGFVMIWSPYPSTTLGDRDYRVEGLAPIALPGQTALPDIPADATLSTARLEMLAGPPVITLAWRQASSGERGLFDLSTAQKIEEISEAEALAVARTYLARHVSPANRRSRRIKERDEFSVGYARRPVLACRPQRSRKTDPLHLVEDGQTSRQRTTSSLRFWTWLGAIPHWLYFTELRKDGTLWDNVIIWTSLAGCFLTLLGLFVGIRQFRRRHSTGKLASPYRGAKFWHHMLGLVFGVLVLTLTFSGFTSMQPWGWLESERGDRRGDRSSHRQTSSLGEGTPRARSPVRRAARRSARTSASSVSRSRTANPYFLWRLADGSREPLWRRGQPGALRRRSS